MKVFADQQTAKRGLRSSTYLDNVTDVTCHETPKNPAVAASFKPYIKHVADANVKCMLSNARNYETAAVYGTQETCFKCRWKARVVNARDR